MPQRQSSHRVVNLHEARARNIEKRQEDMVKYLLGTVQANLHDMPIAFTYVAVHPSGKVTAGTHGIEPHHIPIIDRVHHEHHQTIFKDAIG